MNNTSQVYQKQGDYASGKDSPKAEGTGEGAKRRPGDKPEPARSVDAAADSAAESIKQAEGRAKDVLGTAEREAQDLLKEVKGRLTPIDEWVRMTTAEHPYLVVGTALGVSYMAGFLVRRRAAVTVGAAVGFLAGCLLSGQSVLMSRKAPEAGK